MASKSNALPPLDVMLGMEADLFRQRVQKALDVMVQLCGWVAQFEGGMQPAPVLVVSGAWASLSMGCRDLVLWDTEQGYDCKDEESDEPDFDACVRAYKRHVSDLSSWPKEEK